MKRARQEASDSMFEWDALFLQAAQTAEGYERLEGMRLERAARWVVGAATWPKGRG